VETTEELYRFLRKKAIEEYPHMMIIAVELKMKRSLDYGTRLMPVVKMVGISKIYHDESKKIVESGKYLTLTIQDFEEGEKENEGVEFEMILSGDYEISPWGVGSGTTWVNGYGHVREELSSAWSELLKVVKVGTNIEHTPRCFVGSRSEDSSLASLYMPLPGEHEKGYICPECFGKGTELTYSWKLSAHHTLKSRRRRLERKKEEAKGGRE